MNKSHDRNKRLNHFKWLLVLTASMICGTAFASPLEWKFEVLLDDAKIGYHTFQLKTQDDAQVFESMAEFNVKILFFNAYRYTHQNVETWEGNCLSSITSNTNDNGTPYKVNGMRQSEKFIVETTNTRSTLPECPMSFAYWNPEILDETRLLNSQTGEYVPVSIRKLGEASLEIDSNMIKTDHYFIEAEGMSIELWYSKQGEWLALQSTTKSGKTIKYRLTGGTLHANKRASLPGETS